MRAWLLAVAVATFSASDGDKTITKVVKLLEGMLEKSKQDGEAERTNYATFKCFCDTNDEEKNTAILDGEGEIARMESFLVDKRAQNAKLSQEVAQLQRGIEENEAAREEAQTIRDKAHEDFVGDEQDLVTGIDQLGRAIDVLAAVGADQTQSSSADTEQFMAADATAAAKAGLIAMKKGGGQSLSDDLKSALREASLLLSGEQRTKLKVFLQAPGNYNAQSGEIVGIIKSMKDTFTANLEGARTQEAKSLSEFTDFMDVKTTEHTDMTSAYDDKQVKLGDNSEAIATTSGELDSTKTLLAEDQTFLSDLTARCALKATEFDKRKMLRANEEAAVAQAISILHSDDARDTFGSVSATSTGATSFLQRKAVVRHMSARAEHRARTGAVASLAAGARKFHSLRLARVATALSAENPFVEVLDQIHKMVALIDEEQEADETKKGWCEKENTNNDESKAEKEGEIQLLEASLNDLTVQAEQTKDSIVTAEEDLTTCRESQQTETETRKAENAAFRKNLQNLEEAQKILGKAVAVLKKFYQWLHAHNAEHTYTKHDKTDSGGAQLKRLAGKSIEELEAACSDTADCVGFNSAGWLKSELAPEEEWFDWDGGDLYVKTFADQAFALVQAPIEGEPETFQKEVGQASEGKGAVGMLEFILDETKTEMHTAIDDERTGQGEFEGSMQALTTQEANTKTAIAEFKQTLADTEKSIEETHENKAATEREHAAIVKYMGEIEPGCTFYLSNFETRTTNRAGEKTALEGAITTLEGTPAFQAAVAKQEREDLGACVGPCDEFGSDHAECLACQKGVTPAGYCAQNDAPGCSDVGASASAGALA